MPELDGVSHHRASVNGIELHYAEAGEGDPVVLLHGWPQHWWMWRDHIGPLAERFRVIVPDLRGHGWSDKPRSSYRKTEFRDDLLALLDRLEIDRVRLVGHDWGGYATMLAALHAPERVERAVVMSIPHPWPRRPPDPLTLLVGTYQIVLGGPWGPLAVRRLGFGRLVLRRGRSAGAYTDEELDAFDDVLRRPDTAEATKRIYRTFMLRELRPGSFDGERLTVPILWLIGAKDVFARMVDDGWRDHADDMTLEVIPGAGHFLPEELPQTVTERLLAFL